MPDELQIEPPIVAPERSRATSILSTVGELIDYMQRHDPQGEAWHGVREAALTAAAAPSPENMDTLRRLAEEAFQVESISAE
jgi:hypothetical protein